MSVSRDWASLSKDVLGIIFSHVFSDGPKRLSRSCSTVCKHWHQVVVLTLKQNSRWSGLDACARACKELSCGGIAAEMLVAFVVPKPALGSTIPDANALKKSRILKKDVNEVYQSKKIFLVVGFQSFFPNSGSIQSLRRMTGTRQNIQRSARIFLKQLISITEQRFSWKMNRCIRSLKMDVLLYLEMKFRICAMFHTKCRD